VNISALFVIYFLTFSEAYAKMQTFVCVFDNLLTNEEKNGIIEASEGARMSSEKGFFDYEL
jgi:hypothetical protein